MLTLLTISEGRGNRVASAGQASTKDQIQEADGENHREHTPLERRASSFEGDKDGPVCDG